MWERTSMQSDRRIRFAVCGGQRCVSESVERAARQGRHARRTRPAGFASPTPGIAAPHFVFAIDQSPARFDCSRLEAPLVRCDTASPDLRCAHRSPPGLLVMSRADAQLCRRPRYIGAVRPKRNGGSSQAVTSRARPQVSATEWARGSCESLARSIGPHQASAGSAARQRNDE